MPSHQSPHSIGRHRRLLLAEFRSPEHLERAIDHLLARGCTRLDTFTPYALKSVEKKITRRSSIPAIMLGAGVFGALFAYVLQYWLNGVLFPINVGGRPLHSGPAFIPITFESAVLFSACTGFVALIVKCGLPALYSPVFEVPGFERASIDTFWVGVEVADPRFDDRLPLELGELGATRVEETPQ